MPFHQGTRASPYFIASSSVIARTAAYAAVEPVAVILDFLASALVECGPQQPVMVGDQRRVPVPKVLQQTRGPLDVGEEEGNGAGWVIGRRRPPELGGTSPGQFR